MIAACRADSGVAGPAPLSSEEFRLFQELIHREAGIHLTDAKRALLVGRLSRRLRELGLATFRDYHHLVTRVDPAERVLMLDCVATNETRFFREPRQFDFVRECLVPAWRDAAARGARPRRLRAWSAACSTGEEPYSLAMTLLQALGADGAAWEVEILASDLSTRVLARAAAGVWPLARAGEIPEAERRRFMLRGTRSQEGFMKAGPEIRSVVRFERVNLNTDPYPAGAFDVIFCRNVLIYFDAATKARVLRQIASRLTPEGHLFLGHAEGVLGAGAWLERVAPAIYVKRP